MEYEYEIKTPIQDSQIQSLLKYGKDMTAAKSEKKKANPVIGRVEEIEAVIATLSRKTKNNVVLVGEPGVGKTAVAEGLAELISKNENIPKDFKNVRLISLDMGNLISGAKYQGVFEERIKYILKEVENSRGRVILFIDEIHLMLGAGRSEGGSMDAANLFKPMLARGKFRCIGATTLDEYRKYVEKDAAFERRFQKVMVTEPSVNKTKEILKKLKEAYEVYHGVRIDDEALTTAVDLSHKYITDRNFPDKAIDLLDQACSNVKVKLNSTPQEILELRERIRDKEVQLKSVMSKSTNSSHNEEENLENQIKKFKDDLAEELKKHKQKTEKLNELKRLRRDKNDYITAMEEINRRNRKDDAVGNAIEGETKGDNTTEDAKEDKTKKKERENDLARIADIKYSALPDIEGIINRRQKRLGNSNDLINSDHIVELVFKMTGIPKDILKKNENERVSDLKTKLEEKVVGQNNAVEAVVNTMRRFQLELSDSKQPTASFLFVGPPGVGKTHLAKALTEHLFDDEKHMVHLDMVEYSNSQSISRLIGSSGDNEVGQLTEAVKRRPYSLVLIHKVEKADSSIQNILVKVLDEGYLTNGQNKKIDFHNTVIVFTTNETDSTLGLRNKVDRVVKFDELEEESLRKIAKRHLDSLRDLLKNKKQIELVVDYSDVTKFIAEIFQESQSAHGLRIWIETNVVTKVVDLLSLEKKVSVVKIEKQTNERGEDNLVIYIPKSES